MQGVAWALDRVGPVDFTGCEIMLGDQFGVDAIGRLWLKCTEPPQRWVLGLQSVDVDLMKSRKSQLADVQVLEAETAMALGVSMVYTSGNLKIAPVYKGLLKVCIGNHHSLVCLGNLQLFTCLHHSNTAAALYFFPESVFPAKHSRTVLVSLFQGARS